MYAYVRNNPLAFTDPTGMYSWAVNCDEAKDKVCHNERQMFRHNLEQLQKAASKFKEGTKERKRLDRAIQRIGEENKAGPAIAFADLSKEGLLGANGKTSEDGSTITIDSNTDRNKNKKWGGGVLAEEATHSADIVEKKAGDPFPLEYRGHQAFAWALEGSNAPGYAFRTLAGHFVRVWDPDDKHVETPSEIRTELEDSYGYVAPDKESDYDLVGD